MTDARLPGRWLFKPEMEQLSDRAWRVWTNALMYANEQGTDGKIVRTSIRFLHPEAVTNSVIDELVGAELIEVTDSGSLQVRNWTGMGQELASTVEQRREANRAKAREYRGRKRASKTGDVPGDVPGDGAGKDTTVTGQDTTGSIRERDQALDGARITQWTARQPGSGLAS